MADRDLHCIGNSLTWQLSVNSLPELSVDWAIYPNRSLKYAHANSASTGPPVTPGWSADFASHNYSKLMLQPFDGSDNPTQAETLAAIDDWITNYETGADTIIIHTGWPNKSGFDANYASLDVTNTNRGRAYFVDLLADLEAAHPTKTFVCTWTNAAMAWIKADIDRGVSPIASFDDMYSDAIHPAAPGLFMGHNAIRKALGLAYDYSITPGVNATTKNYLIRVLDRMEIATTKDCTVRGYAGANSTTNQKSVDKLIVYNNLGGTANWRKALVSLNLFNVAKTITAAELRFRLETAQSGDCDVQLVAIDKEDDEEADVANEWDDEAVTWANAPNNNVAHTSTTGNDLETDTFTDLGSESIADLAAVGTVVTFDSAALTEYLNTRKGDSKVTFWLRGVTYNTFARFDSESTSGGTAATLVLTMAASGQDKTELTKDLAADLAADLVA